MHFNQLLPYIFVFIELSEFYCIREPRRTFHLIRRCQRSLQQMIHFDNVASLEECFTMAENSMALALNYSPLRGFKENLFQSNETVDSKLSFRRQNKRKHFLEQPEEFFNCHALQCPESSLFRTMVNDSRFDYYTLYGNPPAPDNFTCEPEIGLFQLSSAEENFKTAYKSCKTTSNGALAHVVSERRTNALSKLLQGPGFSNGTLKLAYVGLNLTLDQMRIFKTPENEELSCFLFRAWAPGHPKARLTNSSCVAITTDKSWMTVDCDRKLPYICEMYTSPLNVSHFVNACNGLNEDLTTE